ncbi:MAG: SHOCT domain-containing protein [Chloroflexi bacterium]|nr:SHOCT domain-containing protein [Chloroflexota bacterium]
MNQQRIRSITIIILAILLTGCGVFTTSSEPEIVSTQNLPRRPTDTPLAEDVAVQQTEEPTDDDEAQPTADVAPAETEEVTDATTVPTVAPENIPDTIAVSGTVTNGTPGSTINAELLNIDVLSVELVEGQPTGEPVRQTATLEGARFSVESLPITPNSIVLAEVIYDGVTYFSEFVPASVISEPTLDLPVNVFDATEDISTLNISGAWYIVGVSPDEALAEIFMWYFVENASPDRTLRDIRIPLPAGAFSISVESQIPNRFEVDSGNGVVIDHEGLRPTSSDIYQITYLLPYENTSIDFSHSPGLRIEEVNVFIARIFDLTFTGDNYEDRGLIPIRGLGDYTGYRLNTPLEAGEALTFSVSGSQPLATQPPSNTAAPTTTSPEDGDDNQNILLIVGILLVGLGVIYLVIDIRRGGVSRGATNDIKDELLDAIAILDERYENGEIDEIEYEERREKLKERLRKLMR